MAETQLDGPAAKAGIVPGDVVIAVDAQPIRNGADLAAKIGSMAPGTAVAIGILRDGSQRTVSVTLGELPVTPFKVAAAPQQQEPSRLGLTLAPAATIKGAGSQGVAVTEVDPDGLAAQKGLAAGDIIIDISGNPVRTPADVHNAISRAQERQARHPDARQDQGQQDPVRSPANSSSTADAWSRIYRWIDSLSLLAAAATYYSVICQSNKGGDVAKPLEVAHLLIVISPK